MFFKKSKADEIGQARYEVLKRIFAEGDKHAARHPELKAQYDQLVGTTRELLDVYAVGWFISNPNSPDGIRLMSDEKFQETVHAIAWSIDASLRMAKLFSGKIDEPLHLMLFNDLTDFLPISKIWEKNIEPFVKRGISSNEFIIKTAIHRFFAATKLAGDAGSSIPRNCVPVFHDMVVGHLSKDKDAIEYFNGISTLFSKVVGDTSNMNAAEISNHLVVLYDEVFDNLEPAMSIAESLNRDIFPYTHNDMIKRKSA
jgi:hypothetical protein